MPVGDYSEMENTTLCRTCDGRKYIYRKGSIKNRRTGEEIISDHMKGDVCPTCHGSGQQPVFPMARAIVLAFMLAAIIYMGLLL